MLIVILSIENEEYLSYNNSEDNFHELSELYEYRIYILSNWYFAESRELIQQLSNIFYSNPSYFERFNPIVEKEEITTPFNSPRK